MTTMKRLVGLGVLVIAAVFVIRAVVTDPAAIVQPIAFNHNLHVEGEGMECTDCHVYVEELPSAAIPSNNLCTDCHFEEPLSESEEEVRLLRFIEEGVEVPWVRIYSVPAHTYFSHRRHVVLGEIECMTCHGDVPALAEPAARPLTPLTMDWCMDCHYDRKVTNDCLACHR